MISLDRMCYFVDKFKNGKIDLKGSNSWKFKLGLHYTTNILVYKKEGSIQAVEISVNVHKSYSSMPMTGRSGSDQTVSE